MSEWIDREKAIEDLQNGDPSQLYDMEDIKYWLNCLPLAQPEGRSGVFIPDITVKNLRKAPLEAVGELLVVGEMEDIVLSSAQSETNCSEFPNNSDAISRQAAIDVASRECHEWRGIFSDIEHGLKELPSVQPETQKLLDDGTLVVYTDIDIIKITRVIITQNNTHYGGLFYRDED